MIHNIQPNAMFHFHFYVDLRMVLIPCYVVCVYVAVGCVRWGEGGGGSLDLKCNKRICSLFDGD